MCVHYECSYSPERSPRSSSLLDLDDTRAILSNRLPKAKEMMETQLLELMEEFSVVNKQYSNSNVNFGRHQILDFVRHLVEKAQQNRLSKEVFILFSENIRGTMSSVSVLRNECVHCTHTCTCNIVR